MGSNSRESKRNAIPKVQLQRSLVVFVEQLLKFHFLAKNDALVPDATRLLDVVVVPFVVVA